jgi:hypothetical protein
VIEQLSFGADDRSARERVFTLLSDREWHGTPEVVRVGGLRGPARVHELRAKGWEIACEGERGRFRYRLVGRSATSRRVTGRALKTLCELWRGAL